jgi:hypothetical protein
MSQSRNLKRKAASAAGHEQPAVDPTSLPQADREEHASGNQAVSAGSRLSAPPTAINGSCAATKNKRRVDPHLLRLADEGIDVNTAFVDRTRFVYAPDPNKHPELARAFAAVVADRTPQPSRRPLACVDSSEVRPEVLYAMDAWIYEGADQSECIPGYIRYGGHSDPKTSNRGSILSKQIKAFAWVWYKEEDAVAPWKALSSEARGILMQLGLSRKNFPILRYTDNQTAQDPPVQHRPRAGRAAVSALIPNQNPNGGANPAVRQSGRARNLLPRKTEVLPDDLGRDDQATSEKEYEGATTLRRSSVGQAAQQSSDALTPAVRRSGRVRKVLHHYTEIAPDDSDCDDQAISEDDSEETTSQDEPEGSNPPRLTVSRAAGAALELTQQPGSATTPAVRRSGRARKVLLRNTEAHNYSGDCEQPSGEDEPEGTTSLADRLNKG